MREHLQDRQRRFHVHLACSQVPTAAHPSSSSKQLIQAAHPSIKEEHQALAASPWLDSRNHSQKKGVPMKPQTAQE